MNSKVLGPSTINKMVSPTTKISIFFPVEIGLEIILFFGAMKWEKWEKSKVWQLATDNGFMIFFSWWNHAFMVMWVGFLFLFLNIWTNATNSNSHLWEVVIGIIGNWLLVPKKILKK